MLVLLFRLLTKLFVWGIIIIITIVIIHAQKDVVKKDIFDIAGIAASIFAMRVRPNGACAWCPKHLSLRPWFVYAYVEPVIGSPMPFAWPCYKVDTKMPFGFIPRYV